MSKEEAARSRFSSMNEKVVISVVTAVLSTLIITLVTGLRGEMIVDWLGGATQSDIAQLRTEFAGAENLESRIERLENATFQFGKTEVQFCNGEVPCSMGSADVVPILSGQAKWELAPSELPEGSRILNAWINNVAGHGSEDIQKLAVEPRTRNILVEIETDQEGLVIVNLDYLYLSSN